jgi:hypothetical protein
MEESSALSDTPLREAALRRALRKPGGGMPQRGSR